MSSARHPCGVSSAVEHLPYKQGVTGSNPVPRTNFMFFRKKQRVLLLDDDPSMQRLVSTLLKREGYRVDVVLTGRDAIKAIDSDGYAVMLLDLMMPNEGGLTVIRHLESKRSDELRRVLVVTASPDSVVGTIRSSVAGVVQKPFETEELLGAVRRIAGQS